MFQSMVETVLKNCHAVVVLVRPTDEDYKKNIPAIAKFTSHCVVDYVVGTFADLVCFPIRPNF